MLYYASTGTATFGLIDLDEGEHANKPLPVLRYENSRAFVQYVTNPSSTGHALYKRAWVDSSCITLSKPSRFEHAGKYTLIKNQAIFFNELRHAVLLLQSGLLSVAV